MNVKPQTHKFSVLNYLIGMLEWMKVYKQTLISTHLNKLLETRKHTHWTVQMLSDRHKAENDYRRGHFIAINLVNEQWTRTFMMLNHNYIQIFTSTHTHIQFNKSLFLYFLCPKEKRVLVWKEKKEKNPKFSLLN